ncbi:MAG TPA: vanadium-dependent haloperoxidase [Actinomycetota bacterium]|nr:vanadium-dependent haloperoxidase [Actinomycetota bacterium]
MDGGEVKRPITRREFFDIARRTGTVVGSTLLLPTVLRTPAIATTRWPGNRDRESVVIRWNVAALQAVRESKLGPPMVARALGVTHTCIFDAWAAYDRVAVGTRLGGRLRRPPGEWTLANKSKAISFAAYRAEADLFPGSKNTVFDPLMAELEYDPADASTDIATPSGIGNVASAAVLLFRHRDGANQLGDEPGGTPGVAYSDYTGYVPVNDPMDTRGPLDPATVHDPARWQPLRYVDAPALLVTPGFVGAQWDGVLPFAMRSPSEFRSETPPATFGSDLYASQAAALLDLSAGLTDRHKMIAEYWADGPSSELPPGHWNLFAQFVAARDHHGAGERGVDLDVQLFFALTNAIFDAGICAWDNKRFFDYVRPITALRYLYAGRQVLAWGGPYQGTRLIRGEEWFPYQLTTFPTPPFPEYCSGHSTFSAVGAQILKLFTGSDRFGLSATLPAGSSRIEPGAVPAEDVTLSWRTFANAADEAGISRRYGGIHFEQGDLDARSVAPLVARKAWAKARSYIDGHAPDPPVRSTARAFADLRS